MTKTKTTADAERAARAALEAANARAAEPASNADYTLAANRAAAKAYRVWECAAYAAREAAREAAARKAAAAARKA
jgi:hypothetical protein